MVYLDAEERAFGGRPNGGLPKRPRYNLAEKARTLLLEFPAWAVVTEKLHRLIELLNLQGFFRTVTGLT